GIGQLAFNFLNTPFTKTLLFARGGVLGIFFEVAVLARFGNGLHNARTLYFFQVFKLQAQLFCTLNRHGKFDTHAPILLCRSCSLRTSISLPTFSAIQTASPAARVVV